MSNHQNKTTIQRGKSLKGVKILEIVEIPAKTKSLSAVVNLFSYKIIFDTSREKLSKLKTGLVENGGLTIIDRRGKDWNINENIYYVDFDNDGLNMDLKVISGKSPRPDKIMEKFGLSPGEYQIRRVGCFVLENDTIINPIDINVLSGAPA